MLENLNLWPRLAKALRRARQPQRSDVERCEECWDDARVLIAKDECERHSAPS